MYIVEGLVMFDYCSQVQDQSNQYWSLRDIPKFEGKGEQPFSHLMEFEDYLVASGVKIEDEHNQTIETSTN